MSFWILTLFLTCGVAGILALALLRARPQGEDAADYDLRVYRQQLKEVDRDLARGVIAEGDAERVRTEISRRILAADAQMKKTRDGQAQPRGLTMLASGLCAVVFLGGTYALYQQLGAPGIADLPLSERIARAEENRTSRMSQEEAEARVPPGPSPQIEAEYAALIDRLRETVEQRPGDIEGHTLLARHEANLGNFRAAYTSKQREIELLTSESGAQEYAELGEMLILAAGGYVSPEAEQALKQALSFDPTHGPARYYWGTMLTQIGRPDLAFRIWDQTLRRSPPDAPWSGAIRSQIEDLALHAGVRYDPPEATGSVLPGPDADQVSAAQDMSAEDRQDMIRGMVDGLSDRLATEGGTPDEWARLITALGVLGDAERAQVIYDEAKGVFSSDPNALSLILGAGANAGVNR
ncbi:MAG: c-type cytochrome biogenesis protein CcmI [Paracoccaceae bacterium]